MKESLTKQERCPRCGATLDRCTGHAWARDTSPVSSNQMNFGDYCRIEQKRYGVPNEMYQYKVIGRLISNCWVDVPVDARVANGGETRHLGMEEVIAAICCGVSEREVLRFRAIDCLPDKFSQRTEPAHETRVRPASDIRCRHAKYLTEPCVACEQLSSEGGERIICLGEDGVLTRLTYDPSPEGKSEKP